MMCRIDINCDNAAFEDDPTMEVARILRALADRLTHASPDEAYPLRDINGNAVGSLEFTKD
jgi:hypothetical protein